MLSRLAVEGFAGRMHSAQAAQYHAAAEAAAHPSRGSAAFSPANAQSNLYVPLGSWISRGLASSSAGAVLLDACCLPISIGLQP